MEKGAGQNEGKKTGEKVQEEFIYESVRLLKVMKEGDGRRRKEGEREGERGG